MSKLRIICDAKKNHATFVEEFWPEFYTRGRFMQYSMSAILSSTLYTPPLISIGQQILAFSCQQMSAFSRLPSTQYADVIFEWFPSKCPWRQQAGAKFLLLNKDLSRYGMDSVAQLTSSLAHSHIL